MLLNIAGNFYTLKDFANALQVSQSVTASTTLEKELLHRAWVLTGHSAYAENRFELAELAYSESIKTRNSRDTQKPAGNDAAATSR